MENPTKIVEVKNLVKNYGQFCAVKNVSFDVYQGDVFGFLGPNGAGKSTTLRTILSLIKPSSGSIDLFGRDLLKHRNHILSRIGCIVEKPDFYKFLSAQKNLEVFARLSGATTKKTKLLEVMEFVGLKGRENDRIRGFSHGMKQRLGIAQALIHDPDLIILDEPTTGLDPQGIIDIRHLILKLKNERNKTVILSSHILSEIELIANRMIIINKGETVVQGNVADLLNAEDVIVSFTVNDVALAEAAVSGSVFQQDLQASTAEGILLHTRHENIAQINKLMCEKGVLVSAIETKRRLEDYFLKLINH